MHKFTLQLCSLGNSVVLTQCCIYGHYQISSSYYMNKSAKKSQLETVTTHVQVNIHTQRFYKNGEVVKFVPIIYITLLGYVAKSHQFLKSCGRYMNMHDSNNSRMH
jgi:hypothetical protein